MTADLKGPARRKADRVETKRMLGPDAQVDDKALIIGPDHPARTDPFLVLSEDWFSAPGFEWHPHRGVETVTTVRCWTACWSTATTPVTRAPWSRATCSG